MSDCVKNVMPIKVAFYLAVTAVNTCQHVKQRGDRQDPC